MRLIMTQEELRDKSKGVDLRRKKPFVRKGSINIGYNVSVFLLLLL